MNPSRTKDHRSSKVLEEAGNTGSSGRKTKCEVDHKQTPQLIGNSKSGNRNDKCGGQQEQEAKVLQQSSK